MPTIPATQGVPESNLSTQGRPESEQSTSLLRELCVKDQAPGMLAYVGTTGLFEAAGFQRMFETKARSAGLPRWLMRLELSGSGEDQYNRHRLQAALQLRPAARPIVSEVP